MTGTSYRVPARPLAPGERVDETAFVIIEAMPVKSLITHPATGTRTAARMLERGGTPGLASGRSAPSISRSTSARPGPKQRSTSR